MHRNCGVCHIKLFRNYLKSVLTDNQNPDVSILKLKSASEHYSVDFLRKGRVF